MTPFIDPFKLFHAEDDEVRARSSEGVHQEDHQVDVRDAAAFASISKATTSVPADGAPVLGCGAGWTKLGPTALRRTVGS